MRVLICIFDALRPEFVRPDLMPVLSQFAAENTRYLRSRSTYPTETRVNQSAVTTGCLPRQHGIVGNAFAAPDLAEGVLNTGNEAALSAAFAKGQVLGVPTLGQRLTQAGLRYVSLSAGTPGGGRLINWSAEQDGSVRLAMKAPEACVPGDLFDRCVAEAGPLPDYTLPGGKWIDWAADAYLKVVESDSPDVMLLWLCEPDESFHWHGIGSPEALSAIRSVDAAFGRILDHHAQAIAAGEMQVVAMSDHGQISLEGPRVGLAERLTEAGFPASRDGTAEVSIALANGGGLWLRDPARTEELVAWLLTQDWCGPVFTRDGVAGTLRQAEIAMNHPRAPDVSVIMRSREAPGPFGAMGLTQHDAPYPEGGGCHGGLSPWELSNVLVLGGSAFRDGAEIDVPAGNPDILPTVFTLLDLPVPDGLDGRVLAEAMADGPAPETIDWQERVLRSRNTVGPITELRVSEVGAHRYLDSAGVT